MTNERQRQRQMLKQVRHDELKAKAKTAADDSLAGSFVAFFCCFYLAAQLRSLLFVF
jgi:hypothetical protein